MFSNNYCTPWEDIYQSNFVPEMLSLATFNQDEKQLLFEKHLAGWPWRYNVPFPRNTICSTQLSNIWEVTVVNSGSMWELTELAMGKLRSRISRKSPCSFLGMNPKV